MVNSEKISLIRKESAEKNTIPDNTDNSTLPFLKLFRFASRTDVILTIIAVVTSLLNGLSYTGSLIYFGNMANVIVYDELPCPSESVTECSTTYRSNDTNYSHSLLLNDEAIKHEIIVFAIGMTTIGLFSLLLNFTFITCLTISAENQIYRMRGALLKTILQQDIGWHDLNRTDGLVAGLSEKLAKIQDGIGEKIGLFLSYCSIAFCNLTMAFYFGWELASITLVTLPILIVISVTIEKTQSKSPARENDNLENARGLSEEVFSAIKTVTSFNAQENEAKRFKEFLKPAKKTAIKRSLRSAILSGLSSSLIYITYALSFWYGVRLATDSENTESDKLRYNAGTLNIIFFNMLCAALKLGKLIPFLEAFSEAKSAAADVFQLLNNTPQIESLSSDGIRWGKVDGTIIFENVHLSYPSRPDVAVLRGINLEAEAGTTVALVGHSGCGKSTCIQLLQRFYDPVKGRITIDGYDLKDLNVRWWRENVGVVGQEPILFSLSIRDNILLGHPRGEEISDKDIAKAARQANAHDFITSLPHGYDTMVGERGAHLSGGQKQRIAIARALIRNPRILLFDEATSALDNQSEAVVQQALDQARQGRTTIIVAHRLTTIRNADLIYVLQEGEVKEKGRHESLMQSKGLYYQLVKSQEKQKPAESSTLSGNLSTESKDCLGAVTDDALTPCRLEISETKQDVSSTEQTENSSELALWKLLKLKKIEWIVISIGVLGSIVLGLCTSGYAIIFGDIMGLLNRSSENVQSSNNALALSFLGIAIANGFGAFLQIYMLTIAGEKLTFRLRSTIFRTIMGKEISWFDRKENSVGSLCYCLSNDTSAIQGAIGARTGYLVQVFVTILSTVILSFYLNWKLALASGIFVPIAHLFGLLEIRINTERNIAKEKSLAIATSIGAEAISNIRTVVSFGLEDKFYSRFMDTLRDSHEKAKRFSPIRALIFGFTSNISLFVPVVCFGYGTLLVKYEGLAVSKVFQIFEALLFGMEALGHSMTFTPNYSRAKVAAYRIFQLIESHKMSDTESRKEPLQLQGYVECDNVHFSYPTRSSVPVLRGMSLKIDAGKTVALVGHSGCGKSTLIQLLQRFYDLDGGAIYADGQDINTISKVSLRSNTSIVSQEPILFNRTIAENIAYGDQTQFVPMEEIIEAAKNANIHSFIQSLPLGYDTMVGQRGSQLSGGQKQRIAIARALIRNPRILLLDEATSALDAESERAVQDALDRASKDRTCITIAHRLSSVKNADRIFVVDQGRIREEGTHESLLKLKGFYHELWNVQVKNC